MKTYVQDHSYGNTFPLASPNVMTEKKIGQELAELETRIKTTQSRR